MSSGLRHLGETDDFLDTKKQGREKDSKK